MEKRDQIIGVDRLTRKVGTASDFRGDPRWKVSPSQIKTWGECPRKWGFRYIDGIETPQNKAAALGSTVHSILESWLRDGVPPDENTRAGKIAAGGLRFLPAPGEAEHVEWSMMFDFEGILFRGIVDLVFEDEDGPVVSDHKTSSDPARWGLSPPEMPRDVQALTYSIGVLDLTGADAVGLQWTYFPTRGSPTNGFPVSARITKGTADKNFREIVFPAASAIVDTMDRHKRDGIKANDLAANPAACGNFGGCPFAVYCERTPGETIAAIFGTKNENESENTMGLKELLQAKKNKAGKMAPPRASELAAAANVVPINPPEKPASTEIERIISRAVEKLTGNPAGKKAKAKRITAACVGLTDPETAKKIVDDLFAELEAPDEKPEPEKKPSKKTSAREQLDARLEAGVRVFSKSKTMATDRFPYANLRTIKAAGAIVVSETKNTRTVRLASGPEPAAPEPVENDDTPPEPVERGNNPPPVSGVIETPTAAPAPAPVAAPAAPDLSNRQAFAMFLVNSGGDIDKASAMMDAFESRFGA